MAKNVLECRTAKVKKSAGVVEAYKTLRTNLLYTENVKVITITSTVPNEGKTTTAYHLAETFANMGKKILLIDCDLRRGSLKNHFVTKGRVIGLSEALTKQATDIIHNTDVPNLDVILSGKVPPNPSELLMSKMFESIVNQARENYDYIIIDTPPVKVAMDCAIVGRVSDGVMLVIRNDFTNRNMVKRAKLEIERNDVRIIGAVLTRVNKSQIDYGSYGYYKYY